MKTRLKKPFTMYPFDWDKFKTGEFDVVDFGGNLMKFIGVDDGDVLCLVFKDSTTGRLEYYTKQGQFDPDDDIMQDNIFIVKKDG